jgi:ABC-type transport system substrate-binding protein
MDSSSNKLSNSGLVYCAEGAPDSFNPHTGTSFTNFNANARVLFDRLLQIDNSKGKILPSIALRWEVSDDGLSYTFDLREDVRFHSTDWFTPTRTLNAEDVIFSFLRQGDADNPFHDATSQAEYNYYKSTGFDTNLLRIEQLAEHQVRFILAKPDASFLSSLAMDFASIVSAEYASSILANGYPASQFDRLPVGTGPFKFRKYQNNAFIRYAAHPQYMDGKSTIEHLVYAITPDSSTRYARLISGECDVMADPPKSQYYLLQNNPELQIFRQPGMNIGFLAFNTAKPPYDNQRVRQALAMAIDRKRLVSKVFGELGTENASLLPPAMSPYYDKQLRQHVYDPERAIEILEQEGVLPLSLELWALPVQRSYNPNGMLMAELIQENLRDIGISARLVSYEWNTYLEKVKAGEHDLALLGWVADNYDPGHFLSSLISCDGIRTQTNRTNWCSAELDSVINEAMTTNNQSIKIAHYHRAQQIIAEQVPLLPIATGQSVLVASKTVNNIEVQTLGGVSFAGVKKVPQP